MGKTSDFLKSEREYFRDGSRRSVAERQILLKRLEQTLLQNKDKIFSAVYDDLRKSENEIALTEFIPLLKSIRYLRRKLPGLARGKKVGVPWINFPGSARITPEPWGVALIIATWNYPLLLSLEPLAGAIAGGNSAVLKLSPLLPSTNRILSYMLTECFQEKTVIVDEEFKFEELLNEKFDFIFFTGSETTGKMVAAKAAATLTPVILELGGKCPCVISENADLDLAARRIVSGKFMNCGQTCVAPDYLLVDKKVKLELLNALRKYVLKFYGENPELSDDYGRIVNHDHYLRLSELMSGGKLICGGEKNPETFYLAPTILDDIKLSDSIMEQEIFGPILPVLSVTSLGEAIQIINRRVKPLAAYCFTKSRKEAALFLHSTSSGSAAINDTVMQIACPELPFGGVGSSGMGVYHGDYDFFSFSHMKSVYSKNRRWDWCLRFPPFNTIKTKLVRFFTK